MKRLRSIVAAICAVLVAVAYTIPAEVANAASASLSIVPKKNYVIEQGKSIKDTLTIRNLDEEQDLTLSLRIVDFTFMDDGGTPKLMLAEDAPQTTWSLKPYLTVPETVTIAPKESTTLDMHLSIPEGQGAGSYYSAIVYSSGAPEGGNVGLSASGVTLVFASIPGPVNEDLRLEKFGPYDVDKRKYMYFTMQEPYNMAYTLKNNGNVTESPVGSITLRHMFGKEYTINDVNPNSSLALIGQSRTFTTCIKLRASEVDFNGSRSESKSCVAPGLWPGYYKATLNLFYGQNGNNTQEITKSIGFWYMPLWFIILLLVLIVVIAFFIWKYTRKLRSKTYKPKTKKTASSRRR